MFVYIAVLRYEFLLFIIVLPSVADLNPLEISNQLNENLFPFLRFWRRNVNALEMGGRTQTQRMRRKMRMKHKKHLNHREKGLF